MTQFISFLLILFEKSQTPLKVKYFAWLVSYKKVNVNDLLQLRRSYKAFNLDVCMLCMECGESVDHLFLYCSLTLGLCHKLFRLAKLDWVPPRSICDMMTIACKRLGCFIRGLVLWQTTCLAFIWVVWWEEMLGFLRIRWGI